ncbi:MAG: hypothetical protein CYPHOPRED_003217 [Cyphobasidiales sp. Tagirdzhanova-0007]|nr:MAG: hypothetical protein CYPHOPRED_003217 [Cyphobasidiales sp. Tagirdzhanova-0007]
MKLPGASNRNPLVFAKFVTRKRTVAKRKRVLFYGHYDVVSDLGDWKSGSAFTLTGIDGYLYGRGVIDNKGPILAVACAAADLLDADNLNVELLLILEGEEETDSAGFQAALHRHASEIGHIDAVLASNSYSLSEEIPSVMFGLRGRINLTVSVSSSSPDLHSGMHGGICHEPLVDLTRVLATLFDPSTGDVLVDGFYDHVRQLDR